MLKIADVLNKNGAKQIFCLTVARSDNFYKNRSKTLYEYNNVQKKLKIN